MPPYPVFWGDHCREQVGEMFILFFCCELSLNEFLFGFEDGVALAVCIRNFQAKKA